MDVITIDDFNSILSNPNSTLIKIKYDKPKLIESSKGEIIKIFYPKKNWYSSNRRNPYALRFYKNANVLPTYGFKAPVVTSLKYCPAIDTYVISYKKMPGENTRVLINQGSKTLISEIAKYIAILHQKGVFFRAIHLENLLYTRGEFALLDIDDIRFKNKPLSLRYRYRNLKHLFLVHEDRKTWNTDGIQNFMESYFQYANLSFLSKSTLSFVLRL